MNLDKLREKGKAHAEWYNKHIKALERGNYETVYLDIWNHVIGHIEEQYRYKKIKCPECGKSHIEEIPLTEW